MTNLSRPQPRRVEVRRVEPPSQEKMVEDAMNAEFCNTMRDAVAEVTSTISPEAYDSIRRLVNTSIYVARPWCWATIVTS